MEKGAVNITFSMKTLNTLPLRSGPRQGRPLLSLLFNVILEVLVSATKARSKKV